MKWLRQLERKYIPKVRLKRWYINLRLIALVPILVPIYYIRQSLNWLSKKIVIRRSNGKPDIILSNIIDGWSNLIIPNQTTEQLAIKRAKICAHCPKAVMDTAMHTIVIDNKTKNIRGLKCGVCHCPLSAKVRSKNDSCPLGKW